MLQALDLGRTEGSLSLARAHLTIKRATNIQQQVLVLTLAGERHKLGLLLAVTLFHDERIGGILLNEELPLSEVPQLARTNCGAVH